VCANAMALNVPGMVMMVFFYAMVLAIGIWASVKSKREAKRSSADQIEMTLLGNRNINLVVGMFTMTGGSTRTLPPPPPPPPCPPLLLVLLSVNA